MSAPQLAGGWAARSDADTARRPARAPGWPRRAREPVRQQLGHRWLSSSATLGVSETRGKHHRRRRSPPARPRARRDRVPDRPPGGRARGAPPGEGVVHPPSCRSSRARSTRGQRRDTDAFRRSSSSWPASDQRLGVTLEAVGELADRSCGARDLLEDLSRSACRGELGPNWPTAASTLPIAAFAWDSTCRTSPIRSDVFQRQLSPFCPSFGPRRPATLADRRPRSPASEFARVSTGPA